MTPCQRVGIMYSLWHWPAARAAQTQAAAGATPLTMEDVLRSRIETPSGAVPGALQYSDILVKPGLEGRAMAFYWHHTPQVRARLSDSVRPTVRHECSVQRMVA